VITPVQEEPAERVQTADVTHMSPSVVNILADAYLSLVSQAQKSTVQGSRASLTGVVIG
jgi:hypothetical protein